MKLIRQSLLLLLSFSAVFLWQNSPLADYTIQALLIVLVLFFLISFIRKGTSPTTLLNSDSSSVILLFNTIAMLLIFATGGLTSTIFFLTYFLCFGITLIFEPPLVFVFVLGIIAVFLPDALKDDIVGNGLRLGSLLLISPIAYIFGRENKEEEQAKKKDHSSKKHKVTTHGL